MSEATLGRDLARRLAAVGRTRNLDMARVLRGQGIDELDGNPRGPVTVDQVANLTREMWFLLDDELFGLGEEVPCGTFQLLMRSAINVPDLRGFLQRVAQATEVMSGLPAMTVTETDEQVAVSFVVDTFDDPDHLIGEVLAVIVHRALSWVSGRRLPMRAIEFPWSTPVWAADYEIVFGIHPLCNRDAVRLVFDSRYLLLPIVRNETELADYLDDQPRVWYTTRDFEASVTQQVRSILQRGLHGEWPTPDEVAGRLNVSAQHLRRILRTENISIGHIKEDLLRDAAVSSLRRGGESQEKLAYRLGFSDASAFRRAFRRWTGTSPSAYRFDVEAGSVRPS